MYLHLGQDKVVNMDEIIGIFDLDTSTVSKSTRDYLAKAEKYGCVTNVCTDLPKSFIVCIGSLRPLWNYTALKPQISNSESKSRKQPAIV